MSTGKRLAKRSIIGTRVCALGTDGFYYSGIIQNVKSPHSSSSSPSFMRAPLGPPSDPAMVSTSNSANMYVVRFDVKRNAVGPGKVAIHPGVPQNREFRDVELIGPGFRNILDCTLKRGQKVFVTNNGRECNGEVVEHDIVRDEVTIKIVAQGHELPLELKKRLEEVRLLESRRSARLADQERDTNFAQLADMAGDRRRPSHNIDVPFAFTQNGSRKRRPSYSQEDREFMFAEDSGSMDDCNAALILLKLSASPHSPQLRQWKYGSSPGSSSASWSSGSSSPPLSDDNNNSIMNNRNRTTSLSTSDEGIVMDLMPKKLFKCTWKGCGTIFSTEHDAVSHIRSVHLGPKKPRQSREEESDGTFSESDDEEDFYYEEIYEEPIPTSPPTLSHRDMARPPHEDPEYQMQVVMAHQTQYNNTIKPPLPIGSSGYSSSWPHKSQKHSRVSPRPSSSYSPYPQGLSHGLAQAQHNINTYLGTPASGPAPNSPSSLQFMPSLPHHFNTTITPTISPSSVSPSASSTSSGSSIQLSPHIHHHSSTNKHGKHSALHLSPKNGLGVYHHHHHSPKSSPGANRSPLSPNRRTRGENKKCRKIYGMDQKANWCTQCKWKKACTRFNE